MPRAKTPRSGNGRAKATENIVETNLATIPQVPVLEQTAALVEPRKHSLPIPINVEEEIRRRAFELYEQRGRTPGGEHDDWLVAEREILARYQQSA